MKTMNTVEKIIISLNNDIQYHNGSCILPIFYSEDENGNINFDIDGIREQFDEFMFKLQEYNDNSDFNFDE